MFSLIALYVSHRRQRTAEQAAVMPAMTPVRTGANDHDQGLARAA